MIFGKKKTKQIEEAIQNNPPNSDQSYWANVKRQFNKNRLAVWSLRIFYVILFIAIFADFLSNERPLVCKLDGKLMFPVLKQYSVSLGLGKWDQQFVTKRWDEHNYDFAVWPPIPYSSTTIDKSNRNFVSPFAEQRVKSWRWKHILGTDELGRDVAAGMIHGTRVAISVGIIAMSIASMIGIFLGSLAGYFGDSRLQMSRIRLYLNLLGIVLAVFYAFIARGYAMGEGAAESGGFMKQLLISIGIFTGILIIVNLLATVLKKVPLLGNRVNIATDLLIMRLIEVFNSIPGLLLILSIVALTKPSIINVMVIIGFISWTSIARFIRAELLRIRNLEYIEAAQAMGFSEARIIFRHAIPNALTPVLITIAFGIASAILTEAFLSFLGIGVAAEEVTWGSLLNLARTHFPAWWLAIFPGTAIFITVTIFNLIGEGLTDALDPRLKQ